MKNNNQQHKKYKLLNQQMVNIFQQDILNNPMMMKNQYLYYMFQMYILYKKIVPSMIDMFQQHKEYNPMNPLLMNNFQLYNLYNLMLQQLNKFQLDM